jgi:hypothetical protein
MQTVAASARVEEHELELSELRDAADAAAEHDAALSDGRKGG